VTATCQAAFALLDSAAGDRLVKKLWSNTKFFKRQLKKLGFNTGKSETPITPIMVGDAEKAFQFSRSSSPKACSSSPSVFPPFRKARLGYAQ